MVRIRENNILAKNREGKKGLGLSLVFPSAEAIELVGMLGGFDFVNLDAEHGCSRRNRSTRWCAWQTATG